MSERDSNKDGTKQNIYRTVGEHKVVENTLVSTACQNNLQQAIQYYQS